MPGSFDHLAAHQEFGQGNGADEAEERDRDGGFEVQGAPRLDAEGETMLTIPGNPPNLLRLPKGCPFQPRCPHAMEICSSAPPLEEFTPGRLRACFKPVEELL